MPLVALRRAPAVSVLNSGLDSAHRRWVLRVRFQPAAGSNWIGGDLGHKGAGIGRAWRLGSAVEEGWSEDERPGARWGHGGFSFSRPANTLINFWQILGGAR